MDILTSMSDWIKVFHAESPSGQGTWKTGVTFAKFRLLQDNGDTVRLFRLRLVEEVLEHPDIIYPTWDRPDTEACYIYIGKPTVDYRGPTIETPPPQNYPFFIVCILPDGEIEWWGWRENGNRFDNLPLGIGS